MSVCLSLNTELVRILFTEWLVRKPNFTRLKFLLPFYLFTLKKPRNSFQKVTFHCLMHPAWWIINGSSTEFYEISRRYRNSACQLRASKTVPLQCRSQAVMKHKPDVLKQYPIPYPLSVYLQTVQGRRFGEDAHFLYVSRTVSKSQDRKSVV